MRAANVGTKQPAALGMLKAAMDKHTMRLPDHTIAAENGEAMRDENGRFLHAAADDHDDITQPLAQSRWFQASAKAVRMSVLEHIQRDRDRTQVNEQLRVWAAQKVQSYSQVGAPRSLAHTSSQWRYHAPRDMWCIPCGRGVGICVKSRVKLQSLVSSSCIL
jgi:hypothetical protein